MKKFKTRKDKELNWIAYQVIKMVKNLGYAGKIFFGLKRKIYKPVAVLNAEVLKSHEPIPFKELENQKFEPIEKGGKWGKFYDCAWFKMKGQIPSDCKGKHVVAIIDIQGEGCVMDSEGNPLKGLTRMLSISDAMNTVMGKKTFNLSDSAEGGENVELLIETGNNGFLMINVGASKLKKAVIATVRDNLYDLYFDFLTLFNIIISLEKSDRRYKEIKSSLNKASKILKKYSDDEIKQARDILAVELAKKSDDDFTFYCTGHAHLDLAWMWPIRETKRKAGRTFSNQIDLIKNYPDYIYCASQPQMYKWVKEIYPGLYDKVKKAVKDGNIEPVGGMWVEPDCNVPSGESMVRQFLYGKRFFRQEFNKDMKVLFLPDVFGFNGNIPQIMKKSGVEYFLTTKMSWNEYNPFPYHSFVWEGIDGTKILAHMPPSGNYNADLTGYYIGKSYENYKEKETKISSMLFGAGDGGGGPSEVQVEMLRRQKSFEGIKKLKASSQIDFFKELDKQKDNLPVWQGELYLEKHNGTYTTQGKNKYYNRKIENLLHEVETLASIAMLKKGHPYPQKALNDIWEEVLLYQFHDILPGSSITRVYDESVKRYKEMTDELLDIKEGILKVLSDGGKPCVFNPTSFERNEWVKNDNKWYKVKVKPYSTAEIEEADSDKVSYDEFGIYSDKLEVKFWTDGSISSIVEKSGKKEFAGGRMNRLTVYKDKKLYFNAWDIDPSYINHVRGHFKLLGYNMFVDGPRVIRRQFMAYNKSTLTQDIILTEGCPYVEFDTKIDWQENKKMLRADFIPGVFASEVTCDMQFGNIKRSTSTDDIQGYAQYEIPAHKWVDVSSDGYGLSLINDCKYGHRVKDGLISLNLLRSTVYPDKVADIGEHNFKYALYPHYDSAEKSDVTMLGYSFNNPLEFIENGFKIDNFVSVDNENVIIETVKKAEDGDGIIVRLYESKGKNAKASLKFGVGGYKPYEVNLVEDRLGDIDISKLSFTPFEIKSIIFQKEEKKIEKEVKAAENKEEKHENNLAEFKESVIEKKAEVKEEKKPSEELKEDKTVVEKKPLKPTPKPKTTKV